MTIRVLSIDGGGMRGIYVAAYLEALEASFRKRRECARNLDIGKAFRLIVGTSTGAIVGCGLANGVHPTKMVKLYRDCGSKVFPRKIPSKLNIDLLLQLYSRPSYLESGESELRKALTGIFDDMTVGRLWTHRRIALAVPAVNVTNFRPWVFKTPHNHDSNHRDDDYSLVDVCMASSAAPLFRSLAAVRHPTLGHTNIFADGGLWANNPVIVALCEALTIAGDSEDDIEIFALGSCGKPEGADISEGEVHRGLAEWKFGGEAAQMSIAAQEAAFDFIAKFLQPHLTKRVRIVRFPSEKIPGSMLKYLDLDETRPEGLDALIRQARADADMTHSQIRHRTEDGVAIESLFNEIPEVAGEI